MKVALLLQNNTVETYSVKTTEETPTGTKTSRLTLGGHRTDARTLSFSSDNIAVLSASGDTVKVWNRSVSGHQRQTLNLLLNKPDSAEEIMCMLSLLFKLCFSFYFWCWTGNLFCPRATLQVIRTMACEYALCSLFVPGDRQIIIGTKVYHNNLFIWLGDVEWSRIVDFPVSVPLTVCFLSQSGKIQIFDLASGSLLETTEAHEGALWSICLSPDQVLQ